MIVLKRNISFEKQPDSPVSAAIKTGRYDEQERRPMGLHFKWFCGRHYPSISYKQKNGYDETSLHDKDTQELMRDLCGTLAFVAIRPKGNISIREVCHRLDSKIMKKLMKTRRSEMIDLKLPKFEVVLIRC